MKTYRVDLTKTYTTFIIANDEKEAEKKARKMNELQVQEAATYVSDFEVAYIQPVTLLNRR